MRFGEDGSHDELKDEVNCPTYREHLLMSIHFTYCMCFVAYGNADKDTDRQSRGGISVRYIPTPSLHLSQIGEPCCCVG